MNQKIVERTVINGIVQIDGQNFKPRKPVREGSRHRFVVWHGENGIRSPIYSYIGNARFLIWKEDKRKRCSLGATET